MSRTEAEAEDQPRTNIVIRRLPTGEILKAPRQRHPGWPRYGVIKLEKGMSNGTMTSYMIKSLSSFDLM